MKDNIKDLKEDIGTISKLSIIGCNGEFHIFTYVITYAYAYELINLVKTDSLDDLNENIILYKDLYDAFCENSITQEELDDYNNNIAYYVLTTQKRKSSKTAVLIHFAMEKSSDILKRKGCFGYISNAMFELYNLLLTYSPAFIQNTLHLIFPSIMDFMFTVTTPVQDYYKMRNLKNCQEISKLIIDFITIDNKDAYSIMHPNAGPANFIEYINKNVTYRATLVDCRYLCLYQLISDFTEKNVEILVSSRSNNILNNQADYVIYDDISIGTKIWEIVVEAIDNKMHGVFLIENDVLLELKKREICNGVDSIGLLKNHVSHIIFLPDGKALISISKEKNNANIILVDESHSKNICAKDIINDVVSFNNSFVLTPDIYSSADFIFEQNQILGKIARTKVVDGNENYIRLKDILSPSDEIGYIPCRWEIEAFDYNYSKFNPYYIIDNGILINKTKDEAKEIYSKCVLLIDLITKRKFQPKILYYDNLNLSLSVDNIAYHINEGIVDFDYLINEMNKKYFIDQIFPTDVQQNITLEWEDFGQCYIKLPKTHNTITPIERQKLLLNEEKMEYINKLLRSYDYDVIQVINGDKADLERGTTLCNGRYRIIECLGSGGFGKTYKAIRINDDNSETTVAVKEFFDRVYQKRAKGSNDVVNLSNDIKRIVEVRNKFFTEAKKIQNFVNCENIIKVYDVFDENNTSYYSMEYIDGCSLHNYVERKGKLNEEEAIGIIRRVANALKEMHGKRMLHMDVKPLNIMVCKNGRIVLIDFGGAHKYNDSLQENSTLVNLNSPGFTPPEQIGKFRFSPTYDIYSLGATLHFMLSGYTAESDLEESQLNTDVYDGSLQKELASDISNETKECIKKSMNNYAIYRPQTIDEFLEMLPGE